MRRENGELSCPAESGSPSKSFDAYELRQALCARSQAASGWHLAPSRTSNTARSTAGST